MQQSGVATASSIASSIIGLYGTTRLISMPHDAVRIALGRASVMPAGQRGRRETAEHHRVDRADAGAGEHPDHGLGHHRHVDHDPVAAAYAPRRQYAREPGHLVAQLAVGVGPHGRGDRAVVDQGDLVGPPALDVAVEGVVAAVDLGAGEPAVEGRARGIEHCVPAAVPVHGLRGLGPEGLGRRAPAGVDLVVCGGLVCGGHSFNLSRRSSAAAPLETRG